MISLHCSSCGKKLQVKDEFAGQKGKCPSCGATMNIPGRGAPPEPELPVLDVVEEVEPEVYEEAEVDTSAPPRRSRRSETLEKARDAEGEELRNHGGGKIASQDDFFVEAPREIGPLCSAHTTMRRDSRPMSPVTRLMLALGIATVLLAVGILLVSGAPEPFVQFIVPIGLAGLTILIVLLVTRFKHTCTYVGRDGLARFVCRGSREQVSEEVFLFSDATELRTAHTRHYHNGVYTGTQYSFTWTDVTGRGRYSLSGQYRDEAGNPPTKDPYHFAAAAERAWTLYLLEQVQPQLRMSEPIRFSLGGRNWVKLGERLIVVHMNGVTTECDADDVAEVRINQGQVEVRRTDAREGWFSSSGIFKFPYHSLANAFLFRILMKEVVEVPVD